MADAAEPQPDGWKELFGCVTTISEAVQMALVAFGPETTDKTFTATTRKRLAHKSLVVLESCKESVQLLQQRLGQLQQASEWHDLNIQYASKSQEELMKQLQRTSKELRDTLGCLRKAEAERVQTAMDLQQTKVKLSQVELEAHDLNERLQQQKSATDAAEQAEQAAKSSMQQMQQEQERLQAETQQMRQAQQGTGRSLQVAQEEAAKATSMVQRHQEMVARLTADNLVFLMQLRKAEAELDVVKKERAQLLLAVEQQQGPWFDEVRAGVQQRVMDALAKAEQLEKQLEEQQQLHAQALAEGASQKTGLEQQVANLTNSNTELMGSMAALQQQLQEAERKAAAALAAQEELQKQTAAMKAEMSVMAQSMRQMREECNERWLSEKRALEHAAQVDGQLAHLGGQVSKLEAEAQELDAELQTQLAVNGQLMTRKQEVEWQLLSALARMGSKAAAPGSPLAAASVHQQPPGSPDGQAAMAWPGDRHHREPGAAAAQGGHAATPVHTGNSEPAGPQHAGSPAARPDLSSTCSVSGAMLLSPNGPGAEAWAGTSQPARASQGVRAQCLPDACAQGLAGTYPGGGAGVHALPSPAQQPATSTDDVHAASATSAAAGGADGGGAGQGTQGTAPGKLTSTMDVRPATAAAGEQDVQRPDQSRSMAEKLDAQQELGQAATARWAPAKTSVTDTLQHAAHSSESPSSQPVHDTSSAGTDQEGATDDRPGSSSACLAAQGRPLQAADSQPRTPPTPAGDEDPYQLPPRSLHIRLPGSGSGREEQDASVPSSADRNPTAAASNAGAASHHASGKSVHSSAGHTAHDRHRRHSLPGARTSPSRLSVCTSAASGPVTSWEQGNAAGHTVCTITHDGLAVPQPRLGPAAGMHGLGRFADSVHNADVQPDAVRSSAPQTDSVGSLLQAAADGSAAMHARGPVWDAQQGQLVLASVTGTCGGGAAGTSGDSYGNTNTAGPPVLSQANITHHFPTGLATPPKPRRKAAGCISTTAAAQAE